MYSKPKRTTTCSTISGIGFINRRLKKPLKLCSGSTDRMRCAAFYECKPVGHADSEDTVFQVPVNQAYRLQYVNVNIIQM